MPGMENVLFLQSDVKDPYERYARMLAKHAAYYDSSNAIWAVYSFGACQAVLKNSAAHIPEQRIFTSESDAVKMVIQNLARLCNTPHHTEARKASTGLMLRWKPVDIPDLLHHLIGEPKRPASMDWVEAVSKKLPALALLKGFDFSSAAIDSVLPEIDTLVKIMLPSRSDEQNRSVNKAVERFFSLVNARVSEMHDLKSESQVYLYSANLLGLLIQSYDAGRGLLSNALLQLLKDKSVRKDTGYFEQAVRETLRFDPPVHNTRRVLTERIEIDHQLIPAGETILVVLAAANRDPLRFKDPGVYTIHRNEAPQYITYGAGAHQCLAEHFSLHLTGSALQYLYSKYSNIVLESDIHYEPRINVRLPVKMDIRIL